MYHFGQRGPGDFDGVELSSRSSFIQSLRFLLLEFTLLASLLSRHSLQQMLILTISAFLQDLIELMKLLNILPHRIRVLPKVCDGLLLPLLANPTLVTVPPDLSVLDLILAKYAREDDLAHVSSHSLL